MDSIQRYENKVTIERTLTVQVLEIGDGLCAFKLVTMDRLVHASPGTVFQSLGNEHPAKEIQGIIGRAEMDAYLAGEQKLEPIKGLRLMTSEAMDNIQAWGWSWLQGRDSAAIVRPDVFDAFADGASLDGLVNIDSMSHMVFDRHGEPLPQALVLDYLKGNLDNGHYDLKKAVAILRGNPRVRFIDENRYRDEWVFFGENDNPVMAIPAYNMSESRDAYIAILWRPTHDEYRAMWEKCRQMEPKYPSTANARAIFELDLLGLRAGGAALFDDFFQSLECV